MPLLLAITILFAMVAYWGGLSELVGRWNRQEEYSHGFFIPLISIWMLWNRREALLGSLGKPAWAGVGLVAVAVAMLMLGEVTALFILIQYGFLLCLLGLMMAFGGMSLVRVTFLPIAFLVFAIPLPYFIDAQLSWRLQLLSSQIGVDVLRMIGASVYLEGNIIDLGEYKLQVVDACSGLRYLYPLLSIGFLIGYMYQGSLWQRAAIVLSTIPITVLMNSIRIAAVGVLVQRWGSDMADGFLHYFEGWIIFVTCLLVLMLEIWLFERVGSRRSILDAVDVPVLKPPVSESVAAKRTLSPLAFVLVMLIAAVVVLPVLGGREEISPERMKLTGFPLIVGKWHAQEDRLDSLVEEKLSMDDYLLADYRDDKGDIINFYVAYYGSQRKGVSPHSPQVCMPGGGWLITSLEEVPVSLGDAGEITVNRTIIERDGHRQLVYYWFEQRGRRIANHYAMKWYLLADSLSRNRTDGALVRITTGLGTTETLEAGDQRIQDFIRLALPELAAYVPH
jgi:exosortase D (VPLPA-CTERM-specific)